MIEELTKHLINNRKEVMLDLHEFCGPDMLKPSIETRYAVGMFANNLIIFKILRDIGEREGYDKATDIYTRVIGSLFKDFLSFPEVKTAFEGVKEMGIDDPTILAATVMLSFDYMFGHTDQIVEEESSPGRTVFRNLDCKIWEMKKYLGIEHKLNCEAGCAIGGIEGAKVIDSKMSFGRMTKNGPLMDFCRCRGDETCGGALFMEE